MIINKEVEVIIGNLNYKFYRNLGYKFDNVGDKIIVDLCHLTKGSHAEVNVICSNCGRIVKMMYKTYYKISNRKSFCGRYYCENSECMGLRLHEVFNVKYDNPENIKQVVEKRKLTWIKKYGVDSPLKNEEIKNKLSKTSMEKYGCKWHISSKTVRKKSYKTCKERYGVEHPIQNLEINIKTNFSGYKWHKYKETDIFYQSTYEYDFLENCEKIDILEKIKRSPTIRYMFENKMKVYYPDFYLPDKNLIIEIKSDFWYNRFLEKNKSKQKACLDLGYDYIFIINKDYTEFDKLII